MIYVSIFTVILCAVLCPTQVFGTACYHDPIPLAATCSAETVINVFSAISFIYLEAVHDPEVVFGLSWPSHQAADRYHNVKLRIFQEKGFADGEELASISARAILLADKFTIEWFYFVAPRALGDFLVEKGFLNCGNVIQTVTAFFDHAEKEFVSLGSDTFESYLGSIILGQYDLLRDLGYTTEENKDNWKILTDYFYTEYSKYANYRILD